MADSDHVTAGIRESSLPVKISKKAFELFPVVRRKRSGFFQSFKRLDGFFIVFQLEIFDNLLRRGRDLFLLRRWRPPVYVNGDPDIGRELRTVYPQGFLSDFIHRYLICEIPPIWGSFLGTLRKVFIRIKRNGVCRGLYLKGMEILHALDKRVQRVIGKRGAHTSPMQRGTHGDPVKHRCPLVIHCAHLQESLDPARTHREICYLALQGRQDLQVYALHIGF